MTNYTLVLFFHFVGLTALFAGYGLEWIITSLLRRATSSGEVRSLLGVYRKSLPISGPGLLILILSGGYLAQFSGGMKQGWISASSLGIVLALGMGFVLILPRVKTIRAALPEGNAALPANVTSLLQAGALPALIRVRVFVALGIIYLMTVKPDSFASSMIALGISIVLGIAASAPLFGKVKAS